MVIYMCLHTRTNVPPFDRARPPDRPTDRPVRVRARSQMDLADDGNYREGRWFTAWPRSAPLGECRLPAVVTRVCGQVRGGGRREIEIEIEMRFLYT
jgi:hypothetical protein